MVYGTDGNGTEGPSATRHLSLILGGRTSQYIHLKNCQTKRVTELLLGVDEQLPVGAIEVHAGESMELGVHPVQAMGQHIWRKHRGQSVTDTQKRIVASKKKGSQMLPLPK